jgi:hypothetical protein
VEQETVYVFHGNKLLEQESWAVRQRKTAVVAVGKYLPTIEISV